MSGEGTYAPKSPDLSSFQVFASSGPAQQLPAQSQQQSPTSQPQYSQSRPFLQQQPPNYYSHPSPPVPAGAPSQPQPQLHVQSHAQQVLQLHNSGSTAYSQLSTHSPHHHQYPQSVTQAGGQPVIRQAFQPQADIQYGLQPPAAYQNYYQSYGEGVYQQGGHPTHGLGQQQFYGRSASLGTQIPSHPDSHSQAPVPSQSQAQSQFQLQLQPQPQPQPQSDNMPPRRSAAASGSKQPAEIEPSPVRTKFPTARIKRIMQADEEVGKVAQQTPIAVGKALEMFMIHLVTKSADVAKEKNSKRVTAAMLKQVVESNEQWDFLREIVSKVDMEEKAGRPGGKAKAESESEEEEEEEQPVEKKRGKGGRKRKA